MKSLSHPNPSLDHTLIHIARLWNQCLMEKFRLKGYYNLKPSFMSIFLPLFESEGKSIAEIARITGITKQTTSIYVQELHKRGYIKVKKNQEDKRVLNIFLTAKGIALQLAYDRILKQVSQEILEPLSKVESKQLSLLLAKCVSNQKSAA